MCGKLKVPLPIIFQQGKYYLKLDNKQIVSHKIKCSSCRIIQKRKGGTVGGGWKKKRGGC